MFLQTVLVRSSIVSSKTNTIIKFDENNEFTLVPIKCDYSGFSFNLKMENIKGDFEFIKMVLQVLNPDMYPIDHGLSFNKKTNTFPGVSLNGRSYEFHIRANIDFKAVNCHSYFVKVKYHFYVPSAIMENLDVYECFEKFLTLPGYEFMKMKYFVKKIGEKLIEVVFENPNDVKISQYKSAETAEKGNFRYESESTKDIDIILYFIFDKNLFEANESQLQPTIEQSHLKKDVAAANEIPLKSTFSNQFLYQSCQGTCVWRNIATDIKFCDFSLISSDRISFPCHRSILAYNSEYFANIFNESDKIPTRVNLDFNQKTIEIVLNLLYGKKEFSEENAVEVLKFAITYKFQKLKNKYVTYFYNNVDPSNVCELIQIAYSNNFEELKLKCKTIILQKKFDIVPLKFKELPQELLYYIFCV